MKLPSTLSALAIALALSSAAHAQAVQGLDGDWTGKLDAGGVTLTVIFHIKTADGKTTVTLDSPDQDTAGIPVNGITRDGQKVSMDVAAIMGGYQGTLAADGKSIAGTWSQLDNALPLTIARK
jgi:hypothetical protein